MPRIVRRPLAGADIAEIWDFIAEDSLAQADAWVDRLQAKLAILAAIINKKPSSIYRLAQVVDRDFANVQRDCVALAVHGFMKFEDAGDAKKSKTPLLAFDYTRIEIHMSQVTYSHEFGDAA